jgi:hypothetical protein
VQKESGTAPVESVFPGKASLLSSTLNICMFSFEETSDRPNKLIIILNKVFLPKNLVLE